MQDNLKYALIGLGAIILILILYFFVIPILFKQFSPPSTNTNNTNGSITLANQSDLCSESDAGKDPSVAGIVKKAGTSFADSCASADTVLEYFCVSNQVVNETFSCGSGFVCRAGACVSLPSRTDSNITSLPSPSSLCTDSDRGLNENVFGVVTLSSGSNVMLFSDSCVDSRTVNEYVCAESGSEVSIQSITCAAGFSCVSGRCVSSGAPSPVITCSDSDPSNSIYVSGVARLSNGTSGTDICTSTSTGIEYYCSSNDLAHQYFTCSSGYMCDSGRCVVTASPPPPLPPVTCSDSDNGEILTIRGSTVSGSITQMDSCIDDRYVNEYSCSPSGTIVNRSIACTSGYRCSAGACVSESNTSTTLTCRDSDGGVNLTTQGRVDAISGTSGLDICVDRSTIREYSCDLSLDRGTNADLSCPSGTVCYLGACVPEASAPLCSDNDFGQNLTFAGTITLTRPGSSADVRDDYCIVGDPTRVFEWYCSADRSMILGNEFSCPSGTTCDSTQRRCVVSAPIPVCNDPDGGQDISRATVVTRGEASEPDSCRPDEITVKEFFCDASGNIGSTEIVCDPGFRCSSGACVAITYAPSCTDSDRGINENVFGNVSGYTSHGPYVSFDGCAGRDVKEWWCEDMSARQYTIACPLGYPCNSGACTASCERLDPDSAGTDAYTHGVTHIGSTPIPDRCIDLNTLRKVLCGTFGRSSTPSLDGREIRDMNCGPGAYCDTSSGRCIARCRDSDAGNDPTVGGETNYGPTTSYDTCMSVRPGWIYEQYCDASGAQATTEIKCASIDPMFTCRSSTTSGDYCG